MPKIVKREEREKREGLGRALSFDWLCCVLVKVSSTRLYMYNYVCYIIITSHIHMLKVK